MSVLLDTRDRVANALLRRVGRLPEGAPPREHGWIPGVGSALGVMRSPTEFQRRGHDRHGPVFSTVVLGNSLVFVDPVGAPEVFERMVKAPADQLSVTEAYKVLVGRILGTEIFIDINKELRTGLSQSYVKQYLGRTAQYAEQLIERRLPAARGRVDALEFTNSVIFNVIAYYVVGHTVTEQHGDEMARLMHLVESDYSVMGMLLPIETGSARRRSAAFERLLTMIQAEVDRRIDEHEDHDDYMQYCIRSVLGDGEDTPAARRELALRILGILFGAHTNTAMSAATVLLDLVDHPDQMRRVQEEIAALRSNDPLDLAALRTLEHLHRAINETLRLRSTGGIWRRAQRPIELGGYQLPTGQLLGATMGMVNLDPKLYPDPLTYRPSRYERMQTDALQSPPVGSTPLRFGAFGTGRHLCSGRPLAYTFLGITLVPLLRDYAWTVIERPRRWFELMTAGLCRPLGSMTLGYQRRT